MRRLFRLWLIGLPLAAGGMGVVSGRELPVPGAVKAEGITLADLQQVQRGVQAMLPRVSPAVVVLRHRHRVTSAESG